MQLMVKYSFQQMYYFLWGAITLHSSKYGTIYTQTREEILHDNFLILMHAKLSSDVQFLWSYYQCQLKNSTH